MCSLLDTICGSWGKGDEPLPEVLIVKGIPYTNSAAKFWMSFFCDVSRRFCGRVTLEFSTFREGELNATQLYPAIELQKSLESLSNMDTHKLFMQALAEIEMCGEPYPVRISISSDGMQVCSAEFPPEYLDSEIFPYLIVWMLEWAELPSFMWNQPVVTGEFIANGKNGKNNYHIRFELHNTDLGEALYRIKFCVEITPLESERA
jgi:hypothetical protein